MADGKGQGVFQEVDVLQLIQIIGTKNKVAQAKILQKLETVIDDPEDYAEVRKFILDELNGLTRSFVKATFGNIEFLIR
jgi:hypothetical protein